MPYQTTSSRLVYRGRAVGLRVDHVRLRNGQTAEWEVVEHPGAVAMLPLDDEGRLWFVRQYRHAVAREMLEVPAGTMKPDEDPAACAARELQEEIGMAAGRLEKLGEFYLAPGYSQECMHLYLATDLTPANLPQDPDEDLAVERIPVAEAFALARAGRLPDSKSLAALLLARPHLPGLD